MSPSSFAKSISINVRTTKNPAILSGGAAVVASIEILVSRVPLRAQSCRAAAMAVMVVVRAVEQGGHEASSVPERGVGSQGRWRKPGSGSEEAEFTKAISHRESQRTETSAPNIWRNV